MSKLRILPIITWVRIDLRVSGAVLGSIYPRIVSESVNSRVLNAVFLRAIEEINCEYSA
jgi:hypothetical protein